MPGQPEKPDRPPQRLTDALRRLYRPQVPIPPEVDQAILDEAHRRITHIRRFQAVLRWGGLAAAAAALVAVVLRLSLPPSTPVAPVAQVQDINGDGQVDVLDAYLLARKLQSPQKPPMQFDFTGDRIVDQQDVEALARQAVSLRGGTAQ